MSMEELLLEAEGSNGGVGNHQDFAVASPFAAEHPSITTNIGSTYHYFPHSSVCVSVEETNAANPDEAFATTSASNSTSSRPTTRAGRRAVSLGGTRNRNRGHRKQSEIWKFLTLDKDPHKGTTSECMHCHQNVPHHRKSEKARAHLNRCVVFRNTIRNVPVEVLPLWVDLDTKTRVARTKENVAPHTRLPHTIAHEELSVIPAQGASTLSASSPMQMALASSQSAAADGDMRRTTSPSSAQHNKEPAKVATTLKHHVLKSHTLIHEALATHFYVTGHAWTNIDEPHLIRAFQLCTPGMTLPSAKDLEGELLDRTYASVESKMKVELNAAENIAITCNMWLRSSSSGSRNSAGGRGINYMVVSENNTFLMETSFPSKKQHEDAEFLTNEMNRVMSLCGRSICGAVTDNTLANQTMWTKLKQFYPSNFFHGCASHSLHRFVEDIFSPIRIRDRRANAVGYPEDYPFESLLRLVESCRMIVAFFLDDDVLTSGEFSHYLQKLETIQFPPRNQWSNLKSGLNSILSIWSVLRAMVTTRDFVARAPAHEQDMRLRVRQVILDPEFKPLLEKAIRILEPLDKLMTRFASESVPCSEVFHVFTKTLPTELSNIPELTEQEVAYLLSVNQNRFNFMYGDCHGIAYLLDPRFVGEALTTQVRKRIEDVIFELPLDETKGEVSEDHKLDVAQHLTQYVIDATREKSNNTFRYLMLVKKKKTVLQYWLTDGRQWPLLQQIACRVFAMPSSTVPSSKTVNARGYLRASVTKDLPHTSLAKWMFIKANSRQLAQPTSMSSG